MKIETEIRRYITDAYLVVRLGGIRYTALGEFNNPGRFSILQSEVTIFEAIATAGDLTVLANRENARLIRQYPDGLRTHTIDLTDKNIMTSHFYFVQPNDQFYLEPLKQRQYGSDVGITGFQTVLGILSAISSVILMGITIDKL
jgi:polysaccharide export outer membrane protein